MSIEGKGVASLMVCAMLCKGLLAALSAPMNCNLKSLGKLLDTCSTIMLEQGRRVVVVAACLCVFLIFCREECHLVQQRCSSSSACVGGG